MIIMRLELRGHHLLCLQGFQGYGYSEDFVTNMTRINEMRKSSDCTVTLTDKADDICASCPNLKNGICENIKQDAIIERMDREVLLKLDSDRQYSAPELFDEVSVKFNSLKSVENICDDCKWREKCLFYNKLIWKRYI